MVTKRWIQLAAITVGLVTAQTVTAQAPAGATALCKDGSYYSGEKKQGACRGHQGIKEWYGTPTKSGQDAAGNRAKSESATPSKSAAVTTGASVPAGATALCKDGSYYTGEKKQGGCRGHQGIKEWYGPPPNSEKAVAPARDTSAPVTSSVATPTSSANQRPADATGLCKDGTYYTGATKRGACRGHQGVKEWYGSPSNPAKPPATAEAPTSAATPKPSPSSSPAAPPAETQPAPLSKSETRTATPAPGGGANKVWLNTASNVYHCSGSRYYGTTKLGAYMTEAEAKAKGGRPDHGKPCE